jgi:hypothetical protein
MNSQLSMLNKYKRLLFSSLLSPCRPTIRNFEMSEIYRYVESSEKCLNIGSSVYSRLGTKFWRGSRLRHLSVVNLDIEAGSNVDIVADACQPLPFNDSEFDLIVAQAVFEHLVDPQFTVNEIQRVGSNQAYIFLTIPFLQGYHADPHDYQRFTINGVQVLFSGFQLVACGVSSGPFSAVAWITRDILTFGLKGSTIYSMTRLLSSIIAYPVSTLDYIFPRTNAYIRNASEYYYLFRLQK